MEFADLPIRCAEIQVAVVVPYYPCWYSGQIKALVLVIGIRLPFLVVLLQKVKHIHARTGRNEIKVLVQASVGICDIAFRKQLRIDIKAAALHIALAGHIGCGQREDAGG